MGAKHYWDWEKRTEKNVLSPKRTGSYIGQILAGEAKVDEGGETDQLEGVSPGKPFLVGFGCQTVAAM